MIRVAIVDDHAIVREGVRAILAGQPDMQVVGEAGDGAAAWELVQTLAPDVLVLDLGLHGLSGFGLVRAVVQEAPQTGVLVLSMHGRAHALEALRCGARGYVAKEATTEDLVAGVRAVAEGRQYVSPTLAARGVAADATATAPDPLETLTLREREVLRLAAEGLGNVEIGACLFISPRTVEIHRGRVMRKLGLQSVAELVHFALRRGVIPLDR